MTDRFQNSVVQSAVLHVALVLFFTMRAFLMPSKPIALHNAIRVDIVGLPDKVQTLPEKPVEKKPAAPPPVAEAKPIPKPAPVKPAPPAVPKVDLRKKTKAELAKDEKEEKSALNSIRAMEALDKIKKDVSSSKPVRGNIVSAGNSLTGDDKEEYDKYFSEIESKVRENWSLPQWLVDAHLKAQALVLIDGSGFVKKKQIVRSSGNEEFDTRMMDAIDRSSPFPAPPGHLRDILSIKGIVFNFPQRGDS